MKASGRPAALLSVAIACSLRDLAVAADKKEGEGRGLDKLFPLYFVQADPQRWASGDGGRQRVLLEASSCEPARLAVFRATSALASAARPLTYDLIWKRTSAQPHARQAIRLNVYCGSWIR